MTQLTKNPTSLFPSWNSLLSEFFEGDRLFPGVFFDEKKWNIPATNIEETDKSFELEIAVPGYQKNELNIEINNNVLRISGEKKDEKKDENKNYTRREFNYSSFNRLFRLPEVINENDVKAEYKDGILKISLVKKQTESAQAAKTIPIP
ncbi:MAG: Hsp20/alpha crystallin family protein [Cytophagaceae bacterium]|nr:Hsp20/alpha crystallin family protein [Cytophagaceae bacterium]MDW8456671.1 Hsp20/alpha crystallin family protein [Cytophagaceae bacterium]